MVLVVYTCLNISGHGSRDDVLLTQMAPSLALLLIILSEDSCIWHRIHVVSSASTLGGVMRCCAHTARGERDL